MFIDILASSSKSTVQGGLGGYGTEDESTPARRRYQQQAAAAAAAAATAAMAQGGVQRSIKFPPLGAPGAGGGLLNAYGSSAQVWWRPAGLECCRILTGETAQQSAVVLPSLAQLLSYATPQRPVTEEDDMEAAEFDQEHFDR